MVYLHKYVEFTLVRKLVDNNQYILMQFANRKITKCYFKSSVFDMWSSAAPLHTMVCSRYPGVFVSLLCIYYMFANTWFVVDIHVSLLCIYNMFVNT